ncbi:MAG: DUF1287 domain-containing protein [Polyangiaceae bacterium]|nr:DUF1287 domain-containing protein [Polyangiaceae bacterium]
MASDPSFHVLRRFDQPALQCMANLHPRYLEESRAVFPDETRPERLGRALVDRRRIPLKETLESLELFARVRRRVRPSVIVDPCAGHGLTGMLFAFFERSVEGVLLVDERRPASFSSHSALILRRKPVARPRRGLLPWLLALAACSRVTPTRDPAPSAEPPSAAETPRAPRLTAADGPVVALSATHGANLIWAAAPLAPPIADRGIFPDLDLQVRTRAPPWLVMGPVLAARSGDALLLYIAGQAVGFASPGATPTLAIAAADPNDRDGDGIPDALDVLLGAKKTALNGAHYRNTYRVLDYPGGDLPRDEGVCTDVVIRSLRNAGFDLQRLVQEDLRARPGGYPLVERPDRNIDHRRVRNLVSYFAAHWESLPADPGDQAVPWLPGDVCLLDTLPAAGPDHIGIVSDTLGASGLPLLVNNWTDGYRTQPMDLLAWVPVTHRFRAPRRPLVVAAEERGVAGLLRRSGIVVPSATRQLMVVVAPTWQSSAGRLRRFERAGREWRAAGEAVPVRLGTRGLGQGRGVAATRLAGPTKREGDHRSPAGLFSLGTAFGRERPRLLGDRAWPWRTTSADDYLVDDAASPLYNRWVTLLEGRAAAWASAERLQHYDLGLIVEHNTDVPLSGAGSAIFLHPWASPEGTTAGCTALERDAMVALLAWLEPAARPMLLQVPGELF